MQKTFCDRCPVQIFEKKCSINISNYDNGSLVFYQYDLCEQCSTAILLSVHTGLELPKTSQDRT